MAGRDISFDDWVEFVFDKYESNPYLLANHIKPQSHYLGPKIRKVFKYEEGLEKIIHAVFLAMGFSPLEEIALERINTGDDFHREFSGDLAMNNKTVNRIVEFYRRDFELFEYNIGVF